MTAVRPPRTPLVGSHIRLDPLLESDIPALFAAGYAACFLSAMHLVGKKLGVDTTDAGVSASVGIGPNGEGGFGLAVELHIYIPAVPAERRQELADAAHTVCPYSNATRGNIEVTLTLVD